MTAYLKKIIPSTMIIYDSKFINMFFVCVCSPLPDWKKKYYVFKLFINLVP
jgi:hypothetical protein